MTSSPSPAAPKVRISPDCARVMLQATSWSSVTTASHRCSTSLACASPVGPANTVSAWRANVRFWSPAVADGSVCWARTAGAPIRTMPIATARRRRRRLAVLVMAASQDPVETLSLNARDERVRGVHVVAPVGSQAPVGPHGIEHLRGLSRSRQPQSLERHPSQDLFHGAAAIAAVNAADLALGSLQLGEADQR